MKPRRDIILLVAAFGAIGLTFAAWMLSAQSGFTAYVTSTSDNPVQFSLDFSDLNLNCTDGDCWASTEAKIQNLDGELLMAFDATEVKTDDPADSCTDYENDCIVEYYLNFLAGNGQIFPGDNVTLVSGENSLLANVTCVHLSCPQNITSEVTLIG